MLLVVLVLFYCLSGSLEKKEFDKGGSEAQLLLACMVGPLGVWIRWFLAKKLNGKGLGENGFLKWLPFGTLIANVSAACVMAVFAILKKAVRLFIALSYLFPKSFKHYTSSLLDIEHITKTDDLLFSAFQYEQKFNITS